MVRSPALEVISYLKKTDYKIPAVRYLFCILQMATITLLFYPHTILFLLPCDDLDIWLRWLEGQWEDNVSLSRRALLSYAGMAGVARSRRWAETTLPPFCHVSAATAGITHVSSSSGVQLTSGWRTVRSCSRRPTITLGLISRCKLLTGYATSEPPMRTSSLR